MQVASKCQKCKGQGAIECPGCKVMLAPTLALVFLKFLYGWMVRKRAFFVDFACAGDREEQEEWEHF